MRQEDLPALVRFARGFARLLSRVDFLQIFSASALLVVGLVFIYGVGLQVGGVAEDYWFKQTQWILIGAVGWLLAAFVLDYRELKYLAPLFYGVNIFLLFLVLVVGKEINAAKRWLDLGPVNLQPSEFAKLTLLLLLSAIISRRRFELNRFRNLMLVSALAFFPFLLICFEPDLGTAMVLIPLCAAVFFAGGLSWKWFAGGLVAAALLIPCAYKLALKPYQQERVLVFLDPERDPRASGWNSLQSEIAVGSGGAYGKGFMKGTQNTLGFLPRTVSPTDFIFSVIAEETGFSGSCALVGLYMLLVGSCLRTAYLARDSFGTYFAIGVAAIIFTHSVINIGMTIRLFPITGLPLPLVSYGGSFVVSIMVCLGINQSIWFHSRKEKHRRNH